MSETYDIFISYSSKDRQIVHQYAKYLESLGYRVWYDVKGLYTGVEFSQEIVTAIENSRLFVYFSSANANKSEWTQGEVHTAKKFKKQILPVRLDDADYDKSIMLVLLPLQYVECKNGVNKDSLERLAVGIGKYIKPSITPVTNGHYTGVLRDNSRMCMGIAVVSSFVFSFLMMVVSGEYQLNVSLSLFAMLITSVICVMVSLHIVYYERHWNERSLKLNISYVLGAIFFTSYSVMAFGLCFVSVDVFLLNSPSIVCAILSIYSLMKLMSFRRFGYGLLWLCAALFATGSYWWLKDVLYQWKTLQHVLRRVAGGYCWLLNSLGAPMVVALAGTCCMLFLTYLLKEKKGAQPSMWERLR